MIKETKNIFLKNSKNIIKFELIFKLLTSVIFIPLFLNVFKLIMKLTGYSYLTLENIFEFLTNPFVAVLIIFFLLIIGFYSLFDIGTIIILLDVSKQNKNIELKDAINMSFKKSLNLFKPKNFALVVYILFLIPFLNLGTGSSVVSTIKIPEFIMDYISQNTTLSILYLLLILLLGFIVGRWIYSMHYYFLEDKSFKEAKKCSKNLIKNNRIKDDLKIIAMQCLLLILFLFALVIGILLIILLHRIFKWISILESFLITIILIFVFALILLFSILGTTFMYVFISYLFYKHKDEKKEKIVHINLKNVDKKFTKSKWRFVKYSFIMVALVGMSLFVYGLITNKYNLNIEYVRNMEVTAHRGASVNYPENTMAAFEGAKELGADWIELDVQQTKDRQIIVSHDTNFKRVTGVDLNSWEATYEEIERLDAGSFKDEKFKGEKIPLLEGVIVWAKENNMKLNIELKPTGHENDFERQVVEIIKHNKFEEYCVVTSQNYEVLENIKSVDKDIITVYVMSLAFGDVIKLDKADNFSIEATSITKEMVSKIHNEGKQIYGWTVNKEDGINKMINLNVDNIITDDISLGKKIVLQSKNSNLIIELLKLIDKIW